MYDAIYESLRNGAVDDALIAARAAVESQPADPQAHRALAAALRQHGDVPAALASVDAALALAPDDAALHVDRAALLVGARQLDEAQAALARSTGLDPNQFPAYVMQAQLALSRGDLDEADRLARLAAKIAPEHPQLAAVQGMLALRRNDGQRALALLGDAARRWPEEPQLRYALGFAYMEQGHLAFAEQAFRGILEQSPEAAGLRGLIAELLLRQGRPADAAEALAPLLATRPAPGLQRYAAELELAAGRPEQALPLLRAALVAQPLDRRTVLACLEAWRRAAAVDEARATLDAVLATNATSDDLWLARLAVERVGSPEARAVGERWLQARPAHLPALEAMLAIHDFAGEAAEAEAVAERIVAREPGRLGAQLRLADALLQRDPQGAIDRLQGLLTQAGAEPARRALRHALGLAQDRAGDVAAALATWTTHHAGAAAQRLPRPEPTAPRSDWPEAAPSGGGNPGIALLWGAPGSGVERIATVLDFANAPLRADRFGANPPDDGLQNYPTAAQLAAGEATAEQVVGRWRAMLPARGVHDGQVVDWLLWWDNALLLALRPQLPDAMLLVALRDPRDMLLDWLAFGSPAPFAMESPQAGATWLAGVLNQVAALHEQDLYPHRIVRMDERMDDAKALAEALGLPVAPGGALGPARLPPGRWRAYADVLAQPFATLAPVARRLGYAD
jgi:predicted Zn-dependent protease